jgi:hypothetical protein
LIHREHHTDYDQETTARCERPGHAARRPRSMASHASSSSGRPTDRQERLDQFPTTLVADEHADQPPQVSHRNDRKQSATSARATHVKPCSRSRANPCTASDTPVAAAPSSNRGTTSVARSPTRPRTTGTDRRARPCALNEPIRVTLVARARARGRGEWRPENAGTDYGNIPRFFGGTK